MRNSKMNFQRWRRDAWKRMTSISLWLAWKALWRKSKGNRKILSSVWHSYNTTLKNVSRDLKKEKSISVNARNKLNPLWIITSNSSSSMFANENLNNVYKINIAILALCGSNMPKDWDSSYKNELVEGFLLEGTVDSFFPRQELLTPNNLSVWLYVNKK